MYSKNVELIILCLLSTIPIQAREFSSDVETGPWITNVSECSASVLWTTKTPGRAWVELGDGTRIWETFAGRRVFGRSHTVRLNGLLPGQVVKYRVGGDFLVSDANPRDPVFGESFNDSWHQFKVFDHSAETCSFTMFNDIHMQIDKYERMSACVDSALTDFIFLDGDIVSAGNYDLDTLVRYSIRPLGTQAAGHPVMFARGNHEGRGRNTPLVKAMFPNDGPAFHYFFRVGPVAFLVFDQGETHIDRAAAYSGSEVNEDYLMEQLEWAKEMVKNPAFSGAAAQVCIIHAAMFGDPDTNRYALQSWMNRNIVPFLNEAGIDLMLGADLHAYRLDEPGTCGNDFPILTNANAQRLAFRYADGLIRIDTFDDQGTLTHSFTQRAAR